MNKHHVKWVALLGLCSFLFFSCGSTPTGEPESESSSTEESFEMTEEEVQEPEVQEPEVFTTVNFAQKLQKVLEEGSNEEALALFQELPPEYEDDLDTPDGRHSNRPRP